MPVSQKRQRRIPEGYDADMTGAMKITGYSREWINKAAQAGEIPGAFQRSANCPWFFTLAGLRQWRGIEKNPAA